MATPYIEITATILSSMAGDKNAFMSIFFYKKIVDSKIVRSLGYLNWCKVLYMYVDIIVLVLQKANGASQHLPVKSLKSNTRIGCERYSRIF